MNNKHSMLSILLVDDEKIVHQTLAPYLKDSGNKVDNVYDGAKALELIKTNDYDIALIDIKMPVMDGLTLLSEIREIQPELSVVIISGHGDMAMVIDALRLGAVDFLSKPIKLIELDAVLEKSSRIRNLRKGNRHLKDTIKGIQTAEELYSDNRGLIGKSKAMIEVHRQIHLAIEAQCDTILISGETGTGKEVVAREIHFMGGTKEQPFIAVNCPALPDSLIESELFGHVKGAFTGATIDKAGSFELADGGTLFLDEVADLSASAQAKLLRVLETRKLKRVGGSKEIEVNIRVITATNTPLEALVKSQKFRKDLYYRLNLFTIKLCPLSERPMDIMPLAEHFLSNYLIGRKFQIDGFSKEAKEMLIRYDFPGNARELRNIVERAAILCQSGLIKPEYLNLPELRNDKPSQLDQRDESQERKKIIQALEHAKWNRREAAKILDMPYSTLRFKIQKFSIS